MFLLPVTYDEMTTRSKLPPRTKQCLAALFDRQGTSCSSNTGRRFEDCYLRVASNAKTNTARSTTYVLNEGRIVSPCCFSFSKYKSEKSMWITPDGWKTATVACGTVFVGETCILKRAMHYRFSVLVHSEHSSTAESTEIVGAWESSIRTAFSRVHRYCSEEAQITLGKISKEVLLGVHTIRVQDMLWRNWDVLKARMQPCEQYLAAQYERTPENCKMVVRGESSSSSSLVQHQPSKEELVLPSPPPPPPLADALAVLPVHELVAVLSSLMTEGEAAVPAAPQLSRALGDVLVWIEAGLGCRMDVLLDFLRRIEACSHVVWGAAVLQRLPVSFVLASMLVSTSSSSNSSTTQWPLDKRAALFVFSRLPTTHPTLQALHADEDCAAFTSRITQLPSSSALRQAFAHKFGDRPPPAA